MNRTDPFVFRSGSSRVSSRLAELAVGADARLDSQALAARLLLRPPTRPDETPYEAIVADRARPVPTGAALPRAASPAEATPVVRRALTEAVDRALSGVKRVAVMTGGGLDSSALLALAVERARRVGGSAFGVALDFAGPGDDRPHRQALEAHLGCEILRVRPEDAAHRIDLVWSGVDAVPLTWPGGPMEIEMLARAKAHGADCALMGVGADELFDGEPRSLADVARRGDIAAAVASARRLEGFAKPRSPVLEWVVRPLLARLVPTAFRRRRALRARGLAPAWAGPLLRRFARDWRANDIERSLARARTPAERCSRFDGSPSHVHLAWLRHQEQVASGLERRDPYLDPELVRIVTSLPPAWLMHGATRRGLFREAVRGLVPDSIRERSDKASFEPAFARFVAAAGGFEVLRGVARAPELAALGLVDGHAFERAFAAFTTSPDDGWGEVWPVLAVEAFLQTRAGRDR